MVDPRDTSSLLQRAGFTLLTVDIEDLSISYPSIWELMEDLQDMGETNAIVGRRGMISRDVLIAADAIYRGTWLFSDSTSDGRNVRKQRRNGSCHIPNHLPGMSHACESLLTVEIGWKPSPTQPKPLERGSAQTNLKDVL